MFIPFNFLLSFSQPNHLESGSLPNQNQITRLIHFQFSNTKMVFHDYNMYVLHGWYSSQLDQ